MSDDNAVSKNNDLTSSTNGISAFRGNFTHTVDEKGRVSLPADFRRILVSNNEDKVVITNYISDGARCLEGFSVGAWEEFEGRLRKKSRFDPQVQKLENFYLSRSSECQLDGSGRILLPAYLKAYASIEKEATFTSSIHGFRIWDRRVWEHVFEMAESALMENPAIFANIDI
jgi:MraZ protein